MPAFHVILLALLPLLLAASAICSASETALFSLTQADRLRLRKSHPRIHGLVAELLANPRGLIISILLANVSANSAFFVVSALIADHFESDVLRAACGAASVLGIILFAEVLPKSIASAQRARLVLLIAPLLIAWYRIVTPLRVFLEQFVIGPMVRVFSANARGESPPSLTADDLASLLDVGAREGVLEAGERRLLADVVRLGAVRVREVMTPRVDVRWLPAAATTEDLLKIVRETGFARYPLCKKELDETTTVGIIDTQRVLTTLNELGPGARAPLLPLAEPVHFVPERARLDQLLEHFRSTHTELALCVGENGDLTGVVQIDDVIRELAALGGDTDAPEDQVRMLALGTWEVPGRLSVRDWSEFFGRDELPDDRRATTVGGLIHWRLGRVARVGDQVRVRNLLLLVQSMSGRSIDRVTVRIVDGAASPEREQTAREGGAE